MTGNVILKSGREKSVLLRHPWIFSGSIERINGSPGLGDTVEIFSSNHTWLARGAFSPSSQIRVRIWTFDQTEEVNDAFFERRISHSTQLRNPLSNVTNSFRLVHGESDNLPGVIIDQYGRNLVFQFLSAGAEKWKNEIIRITSLLVKSEAGFERSDVEVRRLEGLEERKGDLFGQIEQPFLLVENGISFEVDLASGQKTGFYLDQRSNRERMLDYATGKRILNCFCYSGGFSLYALKAGANEVISVDSSSEALEIAKRNLLVNQFDPKKANWLEADVFQYLRLLRDKNEKFDLIILDPPKFAPTVNQLERAARGYKDINLLALKLLNPGGHLFTFSCSGGVSSEFFQKIIAGAALDAGVFVRIIEKLHAGADHPVALNFPEGEYLKGLICGV